MFRFDVYDSDSETGFPEAKTVKKLNDQMSKLEIVKTKRRIRRSLYRQILASSGNKFTVILDWQYMENELRFNCPLGDYFNDYVVEFLRSKGYKVEMTVSSDEETQFSVQLLAETGVVNSTPQ